MTSTPSGDDPPLWTSPFEELLRQQLDVCAGAVHPGPILGTPAQDIVSWEGAQKYSDDCAIKCQQFILEQFTGHPVEEDLLIREAMMHGWYAPGHGTMPNDVGKLLELHDVGVTRYEHANQFHLAHELLQGHKVIVGVEAERLWHRDPLLDSIRDLLGIHGTADHAVVVSGIDTHDPAHVMVQLSDPGTGQPLATYPLEQFIDAWRGSDFFMVATQNAVPSHLPEMAHFDYCLGHVPEIADVSYEHFLEFVNQPDHLERVVHHYVEIHHCFHAPDDLGGPPVFELPGHFHGELPGGVDGLHDPLAVFQPHLSHDASTQELHAPVPADLPPDAVATQAAFDPQSEHQPLLGHILDSLIDPMEPMNHALDVIGDPLCIMDPIDALSDATAFMPDDAVPGDLR